MKTFKKLLPILTIVFFLQACDDNDPVQTNTIADLAVASPNLTSLVAALQKTDLVATFAGTTQYTVLAPTNDAFDAFLTANNFNSLDDVPTNLLKEVLMNHVISGSLQSTDLSTGYANTLATSAASNTPMSIYIDISSGVKFNGVSMVSQANIQADNGVIHIVDAVIGLPSVVDFVLADSNFSVLEAALTRSDLTTDFASILSTANGTAPAPFTVFAPDNTAFANVLGELNLMMLSEIPVQTLDTTLKYHVIGGSNALDSSLSDNLTLNTLAGPITANVTNGATLTDANNRVSNITATNIQANNGVIHVISKVILP